MRLSSRKWQVLILAGIISVLATGCAGPSIPVTLMASKTVISLGEQTNIECILPESTANITYDWSSRGGSMAGDGVSAGWSANISGDYTIKVKVKGENGERGTASITITVNDNHSPLIEDFVITANEPKYLKNMRVLKNQKYFIECISHDKDDDKLTYTWSCDEGRVSGDGNTITWTAPSKKAEATVTVTVMDGNGGSTTESLVFDVKTCGCAFK